MPNCLVSINWRSRARGREGKERIPNSNFSFQLSCSLPVMPSVLRRAIGVLKDQASISLAKLLTASHSDLEVAILKATSHDEVAPEERHITEILLLMLSAPNGSTTCVQALTRRIARTRTWAVALKSLLIAYHCMCDGGPDFSREASNLISPAGSRCLLDVSNFSDSSSVSSPWDYTAFVRTFGRYLDARLELTLLGKLRNLQRRNRHAQLIANMKLPVVLEHIKHWQRLLDRVISTQPTGPARFNHLIHISLYVVIRESFDLYRDASSGLSLLLDNFFHLQHQLRIETFHVCSKAVKQFEELESFYSLCKKIGIGRISEYPSIQMISATLVKTLEDFLIDHRPSHVRSPGAKLITHQSKPALGNSSRPSSEYWEARTSSSSILSAGETTADWESATSEKNGAYGRHHDMSAQPSTSSNAETGARPLPASLASDEKNSRIVPSDQPGNSNKPDSEGWELLLVETAKNMSNRESSKQMNERKQIPSYAQGQLILVEAADSTSKHQNSKHINKRKQYQTNAQGEPVFVESMNISNYQCGSHINQRKQFQSDAQGIHQEYKNPFLQGFDQRKAETISWQRAALAPPTFQAARVNEANVPKETDPFASPESISSSVDATTRQQLQLHEQQKWIEQQRKIFEKNLVDHNRL